MKFEVSAVVSDLLPVHREHPLRMSPCMGRGLPQWGHVGTQEREGES